MEVDELSSSLLRYRGRCRAWQPHAAWALRLGDELAEADASLCGLRRPTEEGLSEGLAEAAGDGPSCGASAQVPAMPGGAGHAWGAPLAAWEDRAARASRRWSTDPEPPGSEGSCTDPEMPELVPVTPILVETPLTLTPRTIGSDVEDCLEELDGGDMDPSDNQKGGLGSCWGSAALREALMGIGDCSSGDQR